MTQPPLLELRDICKHYPPPDGRHDETLIVRAIDKVNVTIEAGDFVAIIGPSGSGKSTLMHILGLLDSPSSGKILLNGEDISSADDARLSEIRSQTIGFVFQSYNLLPQISAAENVELPLIYAGTADRRARVEELLTRVGLETRMDHRPNQLSGGQQQRVAVARSLANNPRLILADEPTGNLNRETARDVMQALQDMNDHGVTVVLVTHDAEIAAFARRVITIVDGKVADDTRRAERVRAQPDSWVNVAPQKDSKLRIAWRMLYENFRIAYSALRTNKTRTMLSTLGIMIGVASVIAMMALGRGARAALETELKRLGSNLVTIRSGGRRFGPLGATSSAPLTLGDLSAIEQLKVAGFPITRVSPETSGSAAATYANKNTTTKIYGANVDYPYMYDALPEIGRFFSREEDNRREKVCILGRSVVTALFGTAVNVIGSIVKINRIPFRVIGIMPFKGSSRFGDQDDIIIVPFETAMFRIFGKARPESISVQARTTGDVDYVIELLASTLRHRHRLRPDADDDFTIHNMASVREALASTTRTMGMLLGIIGGISLVVGGIGIMNIMMVSVKERTREIGLRKAIGARNGHILVQFLVESASLGVLGGIAGAVLGLLVSVVMATALGWTVLVTGDAVILSFGFSMATGLAFGVWPARQAAALSPIEALRTN